MNKKILYALINSGLAGLLVFLGSLTSGVFTFQGVMAAIVACCIVIVTKFKVFWEKEGKGGELLSFF